MWMSQKKRLNEPEEKIKWARKKISKSHKKLRLASSKHLGKHQEPVYNTFLKLILDLALWISMSRRMSRMSRFGSTFGSASWVAAHHFSIEIHGVLAPGLPHKIFLVFFYRPRFYPFLAWLSPGATPRSRQPRQRFFLVIWQPPLAEHRNCNRDPSIWDTPVYYKTNRCI